MKNWKSIFYLSMTWLFIAPEIAAQQFGEKTTSASNMRLNISNIGTLGNAFRGYRDGTGQQSLEWPAGSGTEHLFEGGVWVGAVGPGGEFRVSTSAVDNPQGYRIGQGGFEFTTEAGMRFIERSNITSNVNFALNAISHQDFVATFTDKNILIPGTQTPINGHQNPLFVNVTQETYNWNFTFSNFYTILNYTIENIGPDVLDSVHVSIYANTVVRNINITPAGAGGVAFYDKGGNGYVDSLNMAYCYDAAGDVGFTDTYVAQRFLGSEDKFGFHHPLVDSSFKVNYRLWQFNDGTISDQFLQAPSSDNQRYIWMTTPTEETDCWDAITATPCQNRTETFQEEINRPGNRSDLVTAGPFRDFRPGDKINVVFAIINANKLDDGNPGTANTHEQRAELYANADWAQTTYAGEDVNFNGILDEGEDIDGDGKITRFILPTPPDIPITKIIPDANKVDVYWSNNAEFSVDPISGLQDFEGYRLYLSKLGFDVVSPTPTLDVSLIAEYDIPGNGVSLDIGFETIRLESPVTFEGDDNVYYYKYTVENLLSGWQYVVALTAFDQGNPETNVESLETSPLVNNFRIFAGTPPNENPKENEPFVYPNPYYAGAAWENSAVTAFREENRRIVFANLPEECTIRIFSPAGDLIDELKHDKTYDGTNIRWFRQFADAENPENHVFAGGEHSWDLLSTQAQIISRGIYVFTVTDHKTGRLYKGKFVIIK